MQTPLKIEYLVMLSYAACALAALQPATSNLQAQEICGELGVMMVDPEQLPPATSLEDIRMCADHPLGRNRTLDPREGASLAPWDAVLHDQESAEVNTTLTPPADSLGERACYTKAAYGCSNGYCWKQCGSSYDDGQWCWTAALFGAGPWATCTTWNDCGWNNVEFPCGVGCSRCGCSC